MRIHPTIAVYNHPESGLSDTEVVAAIKAFKHCCDYHLEPYWNVTASFVLTPVGTKLPGKNIWELHFLGTSDQAGALGYHFDENGIPIMRVFVKTDQKYGLSWQVTATHEIFEALVDPWCLVASQDPTLNKFYGYEVGDPVEGDQFAYVYNGVKISDFVLPAWFTGDPGPYDFAEKCSKPFQILPNGYVSIYEAGSWTSYQQRGAKLVATEAEKDHNLPRNRDRTLRQEHVRQLGSESLWPEDSR
jgi:hypothetical protein